MCMCVCMLTCFGVGQVCVCGYVWVGVGVCVGVCVCVGVHNYVCCVASLNRGAMHSWYLVLHCALKTQHKHWKFLLLLLSFPCY